MITISEEALQHLTELMIEEKINTETHHLRVGVKGGGCSGMTYVLGFDVTTDKDLLFSIEGIPCCIETSHQIYLYGMQIDWQGGLNSRGFTFTNPNA
jgi:iron-sulfur cluster assembly protein